MTPPAETEFLLKTDSRKPFLIDYSRIVSLATRIKRIVNIDANASTRQETQRRGCANRYARVSTDDQNLALQLDALKKSGCDRVFTDKASGARLVRPGLDDALSHLRAGDTLVVWKLDRLGRSVKGLVDLVNALEAREVHFRSLTDGIDTKTPAGRFFFHIMASLAQMERELIVERTRAGLAAARKLGRVGGRKRRMTDSKIKAAHRRYPPAKCRREPRRLSSHALSVATGVRETIENRNNRTLGLVMSQNTRKTLEDFRAPTKLKLALLWVSLMFLYIYNDYFSLYTPGTIADITAGRLGPLGQASAGTLAGVSIMLAVPSLMIFLSVSLPPLISRWINVVFGLAYTAIEALTLPHSALFYRIVVVLELALTMLIVWYALRWPRAEPPK